MNIIKGRTSPAPRRYTKGPAYDRFARMVMVMPDNCWHWTGARIGSSAGKTHGVFRLNGSTVLAHRFSFETHVSPVPAGACVLHRCDIPHCVNPAHLFVGDRADNNADMVNKGRDRKWSKLSLQQVTDIREMIARGVSQRSLATEYNVSEQNICDIKKGRSWR